MIDLTEGNILESDAEALVNTVNCVGVMGKGIALQFKQKYPANFKEYARACDKGEMQPGRMLVHRTGMMINPRFIINFPTKRHWKGNSRMEDIELGLTALVEEVNRLGIRSIAVPPLGSGSGGLNWAEVRPRIEATFAELPEVRTLIYQPHGAPAPEAMPVSTETPKMTRARAALVKLIRQYGVPGYKLSLLEIQKLAYFLQESGEDLQLQFTKSSYGPYSEKLNHPLQRIEGHYIRGYGDRSRDAKVYVLPGAVEQADKFLANHTETAARLARVGQLIEGFETPYGMELLATVYWVARESDPPARDQETAITAVHGWNDRKRRLFKPDHIRVAWSLLDQFGWLRDRA